MDKMDTFRYLVGGYYGISEMDNYDLKEFILKEINDYIKDFKYENYNDDFDYETEFKKVEDELSVKTKLQNRKTFFFCLTHCPFSAIIIA